MIKRRKLLAGLGIGSIASAMMSAPFILRATQVASNLKTATTTAAASARSLLTSAGDTLTSRMAWASEDGVDATLPPVDSDILWSRRDAIAQPTSAVGTHMVLALVQQLTSIVEAYPVTAYIELTAGQNRGDGVGAYVRLKKTGAGWAAGVHTEVFHQTAASSSNAYDTSIGVNIEMTREADSGRVVGLNVAAEQGRVEEAINVQAQPNTEIVSGLHLEPGCTGTRALWVEGNWQVGCDLGDAPLRINGGGQIQLEETGAIYMTFNVKDNRIEFWNRNLSTSQPVAYLPMGAIVGKL